MFYINVYHGGAVEPTEGSYVDENYCVESISFYEMENASQYLQDVWEHELDSEDPVWNEPWNKVNCYINNKHVHFENNFVGGHIDYYLDGPDTDQEEMDNREYTYKEYC